MGFVFTSTPTLGRWSTVALVRRFLFLTFVAMCGCNSARDEADQHTLSQLQLRLDETKMLATTRTEREDEYAQLVKRLEVWRPVDNAEILQLATEGARVSDEKRPAFYRVLTVTSPRGTGQDALRFARAVMESSPSLSVLRISAGPGGWSVTLAIVEAKPVTISDVTAAPHPDASWCFASCRERREKIVAMAKQLNAERTALGKLAGLSAAKKQLAELLEVKAKFDDPGTLAALTSQLDWLPPSFVASFSAKESSFEVSKNFEAACQAAMPTCAWNSSSKELVAPRK